ncbi:bHLH123 protein [Hibiscus syriacus]|uniref:BHLH123 protein n=1 Tax=Hibiscus syriacus TaxID=106335 RepID=A0A6A3C6I9_HIBSY|nr:bHLH123 protein [Hibiscus syriacus]
MASQVSQIPSSSPITATPSDKEEIRPKADFQPSIWGDLFLNCPDQEIDAQTRHRHEELKEAARKTIVAPMDNLSQKLTFIDAVQRLGVSYHFTEEINPIRSGTNWWDRTAASSSSSSSSALNNSLGTFGWAPEMADIKPASSIDSISPPSSVVFQDNPKLQAGAADLHMMELGLSSQPMDWNQAFIFIWEFSSILQGFMLGSENNQVHGSRPINDYQYGMNSNDHHQLLPNSWSKVPQFLRNSPPKHGQLHFSNNAPFWNPSAAAADHNVTPPGFLPSLQTQIQTTHFCEKPKKISGVRDSSTVVKKSVNEASSKRPRSETPSLPAFKVRKEKMGDRISALQQLVSPFGKTDTASVLSEAIEYIKSLHDQVNVLSTSYMKNGAATHYHHQNYEKSMDPEGFKQDLRSRGLCLVPVSSTFPVTHESSVDFWTPTFGGTFR